MARITPNMPTRGAAQNLLSVVDNYYAPARDRMGEAAMVNGVKAMSGTLANAAQTKRKEELTEISLKAKQDAMAGDDPDVELAEVRMGGLFRANSRAYNQTYNETMGKQAAIKFQNEAALDYEKSGMKNSTDPNRFREWMNERVDGFLKSEEGQNPYFLAGAMPYVQQTTHNMSAAHTSNISAQMERNHLAAIQTQADNVALKVAKGEIPVADAIAQMSGLNNQAYATGLDGPKARKALISSFLSVADATDNPEMVEALLAARNDGSLRLTPAEWNATVNQGEAIQADIDRRVERQVRLDKAQAVAEGNAINDVVADIAMTTPNISFAQMLQLPTENGMTMGEMIAASPNTTALMKSTKAAYESASAVFDITPEQELINNVAISDAIDNGEITDPASWLSWKGNATQNGGLQFNEKNSEHVFAELEKVNDPEQAQGTQVYKDFTKTATNRLIQALTPNGEGILSLNFDGEYSGGSSATIKDRFNTTVNAYLQAIPPNKKTDPALIQEAIAKAENDVMNFYRDNDREFYDNRLGEFEDAVKAGTESETNNRYFATEERRLFEEQQAYDAEQNAISNADLSNETTPFIRSDLNIQAGNNVLDGVGDTPQETTINTNSPEVQSTVDAANAAVIEQKRVAEENRLTNEANEAAKVVAQKAEDANLISDSKTAVETLNSLKNITPASALETLGKLQEQFNLTVPTNYQELTFLMEDLQALQQEAGVNIDMGAFEKLHKAALRQVNNEPIVENPISAQVTVPEMSAALGDEEMPTVQASGAKPVFQPSEPLQLVEGEKLPEVATLSRTKIPTLMPIADARKTPQYPTVLDDADVDEALDEFNNMQASWRFNPSIAPYGEIIATPENTLYVETLDDEVRGIMSGELKEGDIVIRKVIWSREDYKVIANVIRKYDVQSIRSLYSYDSDGKLVKK